MRWRTRSPWRSNGGFGSRAARIEERSRFGSAPWGAGASTSVSAAPEDFRLDTTGLAPETTAAWVVMYTTAVTTGRHPSSKRVPSCGENRVMLTSS